MPPFDFFKKQARKQAGMVSSAIKGVNKRMSTTGPKPGSQAAPKPFPGFQPPSQPRSRALPTTPNLQGPPLNNAEPRTNFQAQIPGPSPAQVPAVTPREPRPIAQPATPVTPDVKPARPEEPMQRPLAPAQDQIGRSEHGELRMAMKRAMRAAMAAGETERVEKIRADMAQFEGPGQVGPVAESVPTPPIQQAGTVPGTPAPSLAGAPPAPGPPTPGPQAPGAPLSPTPISPEGQARGQQNPALIEGVQRIQQAQAMGDMSQIRQIAGQMLQSGVNPDQLAGYFQQLGIGREVIDRFLRPKFG